MHVYHYSVRSDNNYADGLVRSNQQIFTDDEYAHLKDSIMKNLGFNKITITSLTYFGYINKIQREKPIINKPILMV